VATFIALLRAVNLAGLNKVGMADLRDFAQDLGFENPKTLLQSGNLVFSAASRSGDRLEATLEQAAKEQLGVATDFFVRTASEWKAVIAGNPFSTEAKRDPGHLLAVVLKAAPDRARVSALQDVIKGREQVRVKGRLAYVTYPDGIGRSKLTMAVIEKALGTRGTGRNWNTVLKLGALAGA
jgi:uncharacterized protein (DUF1697 family)